MDECVWTPVFKNCEPVFKGQFLKTGGIWRTFSKEWVAIHVIILNF
jgi:hypothetical protein